MYLEPLFQTSPYNYELCHLNSVENVELPREEERNWPIKYG